MEVGARPITTPSTRQTISLQCVDGLFTWRPTDRRIARETSDLLATLEDADIQPLDESFFMGYDAPWTLPFARRNEVAIEVDAPVR